MLHVISFLACLGSGIASSTPNLRSHANKEACLSMLESLPAADLEVRDLTLRCVLSVHHEWIDIVDYSPCFDREALLVNLRVNPVVWGVVSSWMAASPLSIFGAVDVVKSFRMFSLLVQEKVAINFVSILEKKINGETQFPILQTWTDDERNEIETLHMPQNSLSESVHNSLYDPERSPSNISDDEKFSASVKLIEEEFGNDFLICLNVMIHLNLKDATSTCIGHMAKFRALDYETRHNIGTICAPIIS